MLIDQPGLLMHIDMDLMGLRQPGLPTNTMVTRCSHHYFGLRLDRKTCYSTSISLIEPRTMFTYRDLWFLKKIFFEVQYLAVGIYYIKLVELWWHLPYFITKLVFPRVWILSEVGLGLWILYTPVLIEFFFPFCLFNNLLRL